VPADSQVGVVAFLGELVGGEVTDVLGLQGEQEDERPGCPGLDRECLVGQAAVQKLPALIVVVEQLGGFLTWDRGDSKSAAEAAVRGPAEEVADAVAALGFLGLKTSPVSTFSFRKTLRGHPATLERLRIDRQIEEALSHGPDPLHLAAVFGLDDKTAIRYANAAKHILETPAEQQENRSANRHHHS
jgi:hypothetical protein